MVRLKKKKNGGYNMDDEVSSFKVNDDNINA